MRRAAAEGIAKGGFSNCQNDGAALPLKIFMKSVVSADHCDVLHLREEVMVEGREGQGVAGRQGRDVAGGRGGKCRWTGAGRGGWTGQDVAGSWRRGPIQRDEGWSLTGSLPAGPGVRMRPSGCGDQ